MPTLAAMTTRKKIMLAILIVVLLVIIWQITTLFNIGGDSAPVTNLPPQSAAGPNPQTATTSATTTTSTTTTAPGVPSPGQPNPNAPNLGQVSLVSAQTSAAPSTVQPTARELELIRVQQEVQAGFIKAQNELQLLRIQRDIAEANKAIATARLDAVTAEKQIVNLLVPQAAPPTGLIQTTAPAPTAASEPGVDVGAPPAAAEPAPTVVSVSRIQGRWSAVLSYRGNLYNVHEGDVLSTDGSVVVSIRRNGIILRKDGVRKKDFVSSNCLIAKKLNHPPIAHGSWPA